MFEVPALGAAEERHVFHDTEHRHRDLFKHTKALLGVQKRDVLRRRHYNGPCDRNRLRERKLHITRSRGHVDHEVVEVIPSSLIEKLGERLRDQRTAPDHRLFRINHEAHGVDLQTQAFDRIHVDAVAARRLTFGTQHRGLRGAIDIGVEHAHASAFGSKRQSKVG